MRNRRYLVAKRSPIWDAFLALLLGCLIGAAGLAISWGAMWGALSQTERSKVGASLMVEPIKGRTLALLPDRGA